MRAWSSRFELEQTPSARWNRQRANGHVPFVNEGRTRGLAARFPIHHSSGSWPLTQGGFGRKRERDIRRARPCTPRTDLRRPPETAGEGPSPKLRPIRAADRSVTRYSDPLQAVVVAHLQVRSLAGARWREGDLGSSSFVTVVLPACLLRVSLVGELFERGDGGLCVLVAGSGL
jgi:hypothetical protein